MTQIWRNVIKVAFEIVAMTIGIRPRDMRMLYIHPTSTDINGEG